MKLTADEFLTIMPNIGGKLAFFLEPLNAAMEEFQINTYARMAMFLAQLAHESGEFRYMEELADGSAYDLRSDLGNTNENAIRIAHLHGSTPGRWWKGHSPIQVTGYENHKACGDALGLDLLNNPRLICEPLHGCRAAGWFWRDRAHLNEVADKDNEEGFKICTVRTNGGYNGYDQRKEYWIRCQESLGA